MLICGYKMKQCRHSWEERGGLWDRRGWRQRSREVDFLISFCSGYYGDRERSRRPTVPIIDILGLGKHRPLKLSQNHTLLKSEDKPPLSRRCVRTCVCWWVCVHAAAQAPRISCVRVHKCVYSITLQRNRLVGARGGSEGDEGRDCRRETLNWSLSCSFGVIWGKNGACVCVRGAHVWRRVI